MPKQSKPKGSKKPAPAKPGTHSQLEIDVDKIRSQIVDSIIGQIDAQRRRPTVLAAGYTQSEGKNYGSYNRE
jgi:hypothetical protein